MYIYICMYVCMYVYIYIYIYTYGMYTPYYIYSSTGVLNTAHVNVNMLIIHIIVVNPINYHIYIYIYIYIYIKWCCGLGAVICSPRLVADGLELRHDAAVGVAQGLQAWRRRKTRDVELLVEADLCTVSVCICHIHM